MASKQEALAARAALYANMIKGNPVAEEPATAQQTAPAPPTAASTEAVPAAEPKPHTTENKPGASAPPTNTAPAAKPTTTEKTNANQPRKASKKNPMDQQTVKRGIYFTPRVYEAIQLHRLRNGMGSHNDSKIVNEALTMYLHDEIRALKKTDKNASASARLGAALREVGPE